MNCSWGIKEGSVKGTKVKLTWWEYRKMTINKWSKGPKTHILYASAYCYMKTSV